MRDREVSGFYWWLSKNLTQAIHRQIIFVVVLSAFTFSVNTSLLKTEYLKAKKCEGKRETKREKEGVGERQR